MEKLIVKNFGAIRNIEIDLKDLTIFIGKTGTGKSTLAKLVSIFRSADFWEDTDFSKSLAYYQIDNFLESSTFMEYQSEIGAIVYNEGKIDRKFSEVLLKGLAKLAEINTSENANTTFDQRGQTGESSSLLIKGLFNSTCNEIIYIPAERGVVSFLSRKYAAMDRKEFTHLFPETLLDFTAAFNVASSVVGKLRIDLFEVTYQKKGDEDYIILPDGKHILLSEAASGQQSAIPALVIFEYFAQNERKKSYTFEEPELNLFPIAQKSLVELLAEKVLSNGHKVVVTTHSPYILTSLNNLLCASKIQQEYPEAELMRVSGLKSFISSSEIAVYYLSTEENTDYAVSLIDEDIGLIPDNDLDSASNEIMDVFDRLMGIYRELKKSTR